MSSDLSPEGPGTSGAVRPARVFRIARWLGEAVGFFCDLATALVHALTP